LSERNSIADAYRIARRAALIGLLINLGLGVVKAVGGWVAESSALLADSVNSMGDSVASFAVLLALRVAQRPPDRKHPYGHARAEAVAASNVALLVIVSALVVGWKAILHLEVEHPPPPWWALAIAAGNIVLKEWLYRYKIAIGKRTGSRALIANAWDHRADALCSAAVLVGLAAVAWGGPDYLWADEAAALVVVVAILWSGISLFRKSASDLLDAQADDDTLSEVRGLAERVEGVLAVEKLRVRRSGIELMAEIHVEVAPDLTVAEGHAVAHAVRDRLEGDVAALTYVLVHIEPHRPGAGQS
jgi:cation diffusion facilitator family transporter